jgi:FlgD Ig-like domain
MHSLVRGFVLLSCLLSSNAFGAKTAFRMTDVDLRDPHMYMNVLGCRDVTDTDFFGFSVNGELQTNIQTDGDVPPDGLLDLNVLIVFDPLDPLSPGGTLTFGEAACTAPMGSTSCEPGSFPAPYSLTYQNGSVGTCLTTIVGTTYAPYTPEVTAPSAPCFVTDETSMMLPFFIGMGTLNFSHVQIAATYVGDPASNLVNGLIRAFLSETDANNTILPASFPIVGSQPFGSLLPGGDPPGAGNTNCASHSDKDIVDGVTGWWFYWNFTAVAVPYTEPPTSVEIPNASALSLSAAIPNPFNPSTTLRYTTPVEGSVRLSIFDASGRFVRDLVRDVRPAGEHEARWDGFTAAGTAASSGVYFVRLESAGETRTRKIVLLK